jgi:lipid-A-disaccharide synthase
MRVFFSTGEASGDMLAAELATAMRARDPEITFAGIGNERMEAAGITLTQRTTRWASLGPIEALRRIPPLLAIALRHAFWLRRSPWDLIVLVDFGAFNLRLARWLRTIGYRRPILYFVPPGAWFDKPKQARAVARAASALTPFAHQRAFYESLGLPITWFGHPLASLIAPRDPRPPAPPDGGVIAFLPGSRAGELERHLPPMLEACKLVRAKRPRARFVFAAADRETERTIADALRHAFLPPFLGETRDGSAGTGVRIVSGARAALDDADAACIASGTAVLEATLREVPTVAIYIVLEAQVPIARRIWKRPYITLPNILLDREVVPELLQDDATPQRLAGALCTLLEDPSQQLGAMREVRSVLGAPDAMDRTAEFALELARS